MKIRGTQYLNELIKRRDQKRQEFIHQEEQLTQEFENTHYQLKREARKFSNIWLYIFFGYLFILLLIYKEFDNEIIKYISISVGVIIILLSIYPLYLVKKKNKHLLSWNEKEAKLIPLKQETMKLNDEVAKTAIAVICLSENYFELKRITNKLEFEERWQILLSQYKDGINILHNYKATAEDYINYYRDWLQKKAE